MRTTIFSIADSLQALMAIEKYRETTIDILTEYNKQYPSALFSDALSTFREKNKNSSLLPRDIRDFCKSYVKQFINHVAKSEKKPNEPLNLEKLQDFMFEIIQKHKDSPIRVIVSVGTENFQGDKLEQLLTFLVQLNVPLHFLVCDTLQSVKIWDFLDKKDMPEFQLAASIMTHGIKQLVFYNSSITNGRLKNFRATVLAILFSASQNREDLQPVVRFLQNSKAELSAEDILRIAIEAALKPLARKRGDEFIENAKGIISKARSKAAKNTTQQEEAKQEEDTYIRWDSYKEETAYEYAENLAYTSQKLQNDARLSSKLRDTVTEYTKKTDTKIINLVSHLFPGDQIFLLKAVAKAKDLIPSFSTHYLTAEAPIMLPGILQVYPATASPLAQAMGTCLMNVILDVLQKRSRQENNVTDIFISPGTSPDSSPEHSPPDENTSTTSTAAITVVEPETTDLPTSSPSVTSAISYTSSTTSAANTNNVVNFLPAPRTADASNRGSSWPRQRGGGQQRERGGQEQPFTIGQLTKSFSAPSTAATTSPPSASNLDRPVVAEFTLGGNSGTIRFFDSNTVAQFGQSLMDRDQKQQQPSISPPPQPGTGRKSKSHSLNKN